MDTPSQQTPRRDPNEYGVCPPGCLVHCFNDLEELWKVTDVHIVQNATSLDDYDFDKQISNDNFDPERFKSMKPNEVSQYYVEKVVDDGTFGQQAEHEEVVPIPQFSVPTAQPEDGEFVLLVTNIKRFVFKPSGARVTVPAMLNEVKQRRSWWKIDMSHVERIMRLSMLQDNEDDSLDTIDSKPVELTSPASSNKEKQHKKSILACCAYCGLTSDKAKLSFCSRCKLVKYCSVPCQKAHWKQKIDGHKGACYTPGERTVSAAGRDGGKGQVSKDNQCPICLDSLTTSKADKLPTCEHYFHSKCIEQLKRYSSSLEQVCPLCRTPFPSESAQEIFHEALLFTMRKQYSKAIPLYKKALQLNPNFVDAMHNLAFTYLHQSTDTSNVNEAIKYYEQSISLASGQTKCYSLTSLADIHYRRYEWSPCRKYTLQALEIDEKDSHALEMMGHLAKEECSYEQALEWYQKAALSDDSDHDLFYNIGLVILTDLYIESRVVDQARVREAVHCLKKAIALNPSDYRPYFVLGAALCHPPFRSQLETIEEREQRHNFLPMAKKLIKSDMHHVELFNLSTSLFRMVFREDMVGPLRMEDALAETFSAAYHRCLSLNPNDIDYAMNAVMMLRQEQKFREASRLSSRYGIGSDEHETVYELTRKAMRCIEQKRFRQANEMFEEAFSLDPYHHTLLLNYGKQLFMDEKYIEAFPYLIDACYVNIDDAESWMFLGRTFQMMAMDESKEAEPYFRTRVKFADLSFDNALTLNGRYVEAWTAKGTNLAMLRHDYCTAYKCFQSVLSINPRHPTARNTLNLSLRGIERMAPPHLSSRNQRLSTELVDSIILKYGKPIPDIDYPKKSLYDFAISPFDEILQPYVRDVSPSALPRHQAFGGGGGGSSSTADINKAPLPQSSTGSEGKLCSKCHIRKPITGFSKTQWKKKPIENPSRLCLVCCG